MRLGAGRDRVEDTIDPAVGVRLRVAPGDAVEAGQPLAELHFNDSARLFEAAKLAADAFAIKPEAPRVPPRIFAEVV
jgi:pyrimidine-nucleoside phosphorylase